MTSQLVVVDVLGQGVNQAIEGGAHVGAEHEEGVALGGK